MIPINQGSKNEDRDNQWLVLVPTPFELNQVDQKWLGQFPQPPQVCGFGPIVAAARAMELIRRFRPTSVLLLGIAGGYPGDLEIGQATQFSDVANYGVGVGTGGEFWSASRLGWSQWPGDDTTDEIGDRLGLSVIPDSGSRSPSGGLLLTVSAASNRPNEVTQKLHLFPEAIAEDMEGFAVAVACHLGKVPLTIVRGISNRAGDRDKANWKIREAINSAAQLAAQVMK